MPRLLEIAAELRLPLQWMTMSSVVYGARGSGKTTFGRVIAEEVWSQQQRFCAIDVKGDWYGLKASGSGTEPGIPAVVFGGDHADLPLEPSAGTDIANLVADLDQPTILDLEHLSKGKQITFLTAFFERLYDKNRDPLLLLLDEAQRYAPQKPMNPDAARCLGAVEDLVKLGRKHGLGQVLFTQRGSGLNKEVSELCDMLVAFRTPGPLDQARVKDWLEANVTEDQLKAVMAGIASQPTGQAIFASGHPDIKVFGAYTIRLPRTFDSSATPQVGQRRREPRVLAESDIEDLKTKMAAAIERAKADDPKELKRRIAELERNSKTFQAPPEPEIRTERVEVPVITEDDWGRLKVLTETLDAGAQAALYAVKLIRDIIDRTEVPPVEPVVETKPPAPPPRPREDPPPTNGEFRLGKAERQIIAVLQSRSDGLSRTQLAFLTGYSPRTSTLSVALGALRREGYVRPGGDPIELTDKGRSIWVGEVDVPPPPGRELVSYWMAKLGKAEREILRVMAEAHPRELSRTEIAEQTGYSPQTSTLSVAFGKLRGLKLVDGFRVSDDLIGP